MTTEEKLMKRKVRQQLKRSDNIIVLFFYLFIIVAGCSSHSAFMQSQSLLSDTIYVGFYSYIMDTPIRIDCECLKDSFNNRIKVDTIYVKAKDFNYLLKSILSNKLYRHSNGVDARYYIKYNNIERCLSDYYLISDLKNGNNYKVDRRFSYLLKKYIGFYNYQTLNYLRYNPEIKMYGLPEDYHHVKRDSFVYASVEGQNELEVEYERFHLIDDFLVVVLIKEADGEQ